MSQKQALGKGLASLFPGLNQNPPPAEAHPAVINAAVEQLEKEALQKAASEHKIELPFSEAPNRDRHPGISIVNIEEIKENKFQPRHEFEDQPLQELAASIRANGIIQPLVVRKNPNGGYELIAGERRLRASKLAGLKQVPIVIRKSSDREALELALIENIQRENLNCIEEARAYFQLQQEFNLKQDEIAARVGKERATVANYLRLLDLPEEIAADLKEGRLTFGHGRAILGVEGHENRMRVRALILEKNLSVRATESLIQTLKSEADLQPADQHTSETDTTGQKNPLANRLFHAGQELTRKWSVKVEIKGNDQKGKIVFHYNTRGDLDRLLESMHN